MRPQTRANKSVSSGKSAQNIEQKRDGVVGHVLRVGVAGIGDGNATTATLGEVDVVKAGAGANDKSQRREVVEGVDGDGRGADANESAYGGGLGRGQRVEKAEVGDQAVLEWKFE